MPKQEGGLSLTQFLDPPPFLSYPEKDLTLSQRGGTAKKTTKRKKSSSSRSAKCRDQTFDELYSKVMSHVSNAVQKRKKKKKKEQMGGRLSKEFFDIVKNAQQKRGGLNQKGGFLPLLAMAAPFLLGPVMKGGASGKSQKGGIATSTAMILAPIISQVAGPLLGSVLGSIGLGGQQGSGRKKVVKKRTSPCDYRI